MAQETAVQDLPRTAQARIVRIDHGAVPSNDGGRAWAFYRDVLGAKLHLISHLDNRRPLGQGPMLFVEIAGHRGWGIALEYDDLPPPEGDFSGPCWAFSVDPDEFDRALAVLRARGLSHTVAEGRGSSPIARSVFFHDTEGNSLELCLSRIMRRHNGQTAPVGTPTGDEGPIRLNDISHVRLAVTDMQRAEEFYGEVLGMAPLDRSPDGKELVYGMKNGEHCVILHYSPTPSPWTRFYHGPHIAVEASEEDYDAIVPKLTNVEYYWGPNNRQPPWYERTPKTTYFYDPFGNRLQVTPLGMH
jgi:catechol 2,3-dioxygenase-like lactoylglutathione lyase family enzyme